MCLWSCEQALIDPIMQCWAGVRKGGDSERGKAGKGREVILGIGFTITYISVRWHSDVCDTHEQGEVSTSVTRPLWFVLFLWTN